MPTQPWLKKASSWAARAGLEKLKPYSSRSLHIAQQPIEGNGWADLPAEFIEEVLDHLSAKEVWNSRLISSNWGAVVRDYQSDVVVPVDTKTFWSQSSSFRQRQKQYPRTRFTLKLAKPLEFAACAELLSATAAKGNKLTECDFELTLAVKTDIQPSQVIQVCKDVKSIASAASTLQQQDVRVFINLQAVLAYELTLMLVKELCPFLLSINCHPVNDLSSELNQVSPFTTTPAASFSRSALKHLGDSNSPIRSLCLSDHSFPNLEHFQGLLLESSIGAIASLRHLTMLHLSIQARTDFQPLSQLTGLQDLALQSDSRSASAGDVVLSSSQSIQRIVLSSRGWDSATFAALDECPKLDTVTVKVLCLCEEDVRVLSNLMMPSSLQIMLRKCNKMKPKDFHTLTSGTAAITHLELWELENACFAQLQSIQSLSGLTLVRPCVQLTGQGFNPQPRLETLRLVSCFGLSDNGLRELLASAPSLKILMIQQELQHTRPVELKDSDTLTKHGLVSISEASELIYVDLQGVRVTRGGEKLLESTICAQQKAGKMQPAVVLVLPKFSKRLGDPLFTPDSLHYPAFVPCMEGRASTINCGSVSKSSELKETMAAFQALQVTRR